MDSLETFLTENAHIQFATPSTPEYEDLRSAFVINNTKNPLMIVRPRTAEDVSGLIRILTTNSIPFSIRGGGHDMFGRSQLDDGVTIDLREIRHVHVDHDSQTARIGGGIISMDLLKELEEHKVVVPHPVTPSVGWVGWAMHGGYSLLSTKHGLGVDQIVGAVVVDAEGVIREADEKMLTVIRGGGGIIGVVVEMEIRIYPSNQVLAGAIIYHPDHLISTIKDFNEKFQRAKTNNLPSELGLYQCVRNTPTGKSLIVLFVWASPNMEEGQSWLSKISSWAPVASSTVQPTTMAAFNEMANAMVPPKVYGSVFTPHFHSLSPEVIEVICKHIQLQPSNPEVIFGVHELRSGTTMVPGSVFNTRVPHVVVQIIPMVGSSEAVDEVVEWGRKFDTALRKTDQANFIEASYVPLTDSGIIDFRATYGEHYETLRETKGEYDPENHFKNSLIQL